MPVLNSIAALSDEATAWRRDLHAHPELLYDLPRTSKTVADMLTAFGCDEVVTGMGRTGVVGLIKGKGGAGTRMIGLRADMDALPIEEASGVEHTSTTPGIMHACGHDGHTAMLLAAAKYFCETRNFNGSVAVIFQPAEEGGAGAKAMIDDGLFERFAVDEVYGMHNQPGMDVGTFATRSGPLLAAADRLYITLTGHGGHAAKPHQCIDTVLVGAHVVTALQSIAARSVDPMESGVVSMCMFHAGNAGNVIPETAELTGTARSLSPEVRDILEERITTITNATAQAFGATADVRYVRDYPVTRNHEVQTTFAADVAAQISGEDKVDRQVSPVMGGEDFAFMLEHKPGAFIFTGNGDTARLHHPAYDFNDAAIPVGASYWARLVETALPA
ncbi:MAG: M20 aminoacylase family protein [Pseudomonadota bacterium]